MFTVNTVQKNVMCMMDQEMSMDNMCMSMFYCVSMYHDLPGTSEADS